MVLRERGKINLYFAGPSLPSSLYDLQRNPRHTRTSVNWSKRYLRHVFFHTQLPRARNDTQTEDVCRDKDFIVLLSAVFDAS